MGHQNLEYSQLVDLLNKSRPQDVYEELMKKEEKVLDTINRVVNYSNERETVKSEYMNMSINEHVHTLFKVVKQVQNDLFKAKSLKDVSATMLADDNMFYIGCLLVFVAIFLFFIIIST